MASLAVLTGILVSLNAPEFLMWAILLHGLAAWRIWGGVAAVAPVIEGVRGHCLWGLTLVYGWYISL